MGLRFFFSAYRLTVIHISTKFYENILDRIIAMQHTQFLLEKFRKNIGVVSFLVL